MAQLSPIYFLRNKLIFFKAKKENCRNLAQLINAYCSASGQKVNLQKSSVFFGGNVPVVLADELTDIMGMDKVEDPGLYLGVPVIWGRSKKIGLAYVKGVTPGEKSRMEEIHFITYRA